MEFYISCPHCGEMLKVSVESVGSVKKEEKRTEAVEPSENLRGALNRLDDTEIETMVLEVASSVYDKIGRGLRRDEKINLLMDHLRRNPESKSPVERWLRNKGVLA